MHPAIPLLVLALLGGCAAQAVPRGGGIVSTNPCADAMLVEMVPANRIAAISHYSQDPGASSIPVDLARRFRATAGTAEEVIALHPDLVVVDSLTPRASRDAYARAGLNVLMLGWPATIADSRAQVMQVAQAVGALDKGRAMVARIDAALAAAAPSARALAATSARTPAPGTLLYLSGNLATGPGTLLDELMTRAGLRNAAIDYGLTHTGTIATEALIVRPPALILTPSLATRPAQRRAQVLAGRSHMAVFPRALINCGGPTIVPALARLAAIRDGAL